MAMDITIKIIGVTTQIIGPRDITSQVSAKVAVIILIKVKAIEGIIFSFNLINRQMTIQKTELMDKI